jgi:archaellum component FlaD/FlaE
MAIDPRNYDVSELRAAGSREPPPFSDGAVDGEAATAAGAEPDSESECGSSDEAARPAAAVAFETSVARDLAALDQGDDDLERPYLPALPASLVAEALIFEWLEYLSLQAGRESVADALSVYEQVGWLGTDAAEALERYLSGIDDPRADGNDGPDPDDHRVSLHYVARLAALSRN